MSKTNKKINFEFIDIRPSDTKKYKGKFLISIIFRDNFNQTYEYFFSYIEIYLMLKLLGISEDLLQKNKNTSFKGRLLIKEQITNILNNLKKPLSTFCPYLFKHDEGRKTQINRIEKECIDKIKKILKDEVNK